MLAAVSREGATMTEIEQIVELIEKVGFRCGRGSMQEARAECADFWCPSEDELPIALSVEAKRIVGLASTLAHVIAFHVVRGSLDAYLVHVGLAEYPSAGRH
jgi:hypothetical protein